MSAGFQPPLRPNFRRVVAEIEHGTVLIPLLHSYLYDAKFPKEFSVTFKGHSMQREPDGWFHPSTHPLWPARKLWLYHHYPSYSLGEVKEYMGTLSVTIGHAVHSFIQMCLEDLGVLELSEREVHGEMVLQAEHYVEDPELLSRGSMDGVLKLSLPRYLGAERQLFEFKTSNLMKLSKIKSLDLDAFIEKWPDYYMQVQEYMRMSGLQVAVVLFMAMGYPWELREFHVPADPKLAHEIKSKYRLAIAPDMPPPCCGPGSKVASSCEMRTICNVAGGELPS